MSYANGTLGATTTTTPVKFSGIGGFALVALPMLFLWWVLGLHEEERAAK